jgi:lipid-A-disaccharide synthase
VVAGDTDAVIYWCQFALVVSGTVTLQIAKQARPMVAFYRPTRLFWHLLGRWIISTDVYTLPNLIARRRVVVELIPHFEGGEPLAVEIIRFMRQPGYADAQREELRAIAQKFRGFIAAQGAADTLERLAGIPAMPGQPLTPDLSTRSPVSAG